MTTLATPDRTLHLVDIENLVGGGVASHGDIDDAFARYLALAHWEPGDLVYVAANPAFAREFVFDPPVPCNVHTAHGADGADLALLVHAAPEFVSRRCTRLVIGSGDHIFISRALQVRALDVGVVVVSRPENVHGGWRAHGFPVLDLTVDDERLAA